MTRRGWLWAVVLALAAIAAVCSWLVARGLFDAGPPAARTDGIIRAAITSADLALEEIGARDKAARERVVIVREEVAERVLDLDGDRLAAVALERAERYRRTIASGDIPAAGWVVQDQ